MMGVTPETNDGKTLRVDLGYGGSQINRLSALASETFS